MPKRIQRKRTPGWRLPDNTVCVTRPGKFANPYRIGDLSFDVRNPEESFEITRDNCLTLFRSYAEQRLQIEPTWLNPLIDKDFVACWCKAEDKCHGDLLLELIAEKTKDGKERPTE